MSHCWVLLNHQWDVHDCPIRWYKLPDWIVLHIPLMIQGGRNILTSSTSWEIGHICSLCFLGFSAWLYGLLAPSFCPYPSYLYIRDTVCIFPFQALDTTPCLGPSIFSPTRVQVSCLYTSAEPTLSLCKVADRRSRMIDVSSWSVSGKNQLVQT